ncbi:hypothetical protein TNCV_4322621 [Trichonephila clavipes]|uniref:Uncharacterized protein n=1 Tax=Trichonephila clavipes TaxID=2585209 RepID=A0A8X6S9X4_TRICX|nr:hypothetical protein TNCV_4322621 [Trichonephila clavipes]
MPLMNEYFLTLENPITAISYLLGLYKALSSSNEKSDASNKYEPIVQEVELIEVNRDYAHVKLGWKGNNCFYKTLGSSRGKTTRSEGNKSA